MPVLAVGAQSFRPSGHTGLPAFYAPQMWTRQRRILMPTATIAGTHLCNALK